MRAHQLILRSASQHRLSSGLTLLSVALGALLVSVILLLRSATEATFLGPSRGFALVVGAPGSRLELVLNTVFQIGQSPGLLPYEAFEELEHNPSTQLAVPPATALTLVPISPDLPQRTEREPERKPCHPSGGPNTTGQRAR